MAGDLDMGHARALLAVDAATQIALANEVVAKKLSVRDAEKLATRASLGQKNSKTSSKAEKPRDLVRLEEALSDLLATSVSIKINARHAGEVVIAFGSLDQLDGITKRLGVEPG